MNAGMSKPFWSGNSGYHKSRVPGKRNQILGCSAPFPSWLL